MRVIAVGTGDAFGSAGRGHTCWLVDDAHGLALVDAGGTVLQGLARAGIDAARIGAIHFTHLHGDHIAGWPFFLIDQSYRAKRTAPLVVSGPPGTRERLQALWAACYADTAQRALSFAIDLHELAPGDEATLAGRRVRAFRAQHMRPPHVALSLRIGDLAFTGDTGPHDGLRELCRGARALFAECSDLKSPPPGAPVPNAAPDYPREAGRRHLAWDELELLLPTLGVPTVLLGHLSAEVRAAVPSLSAAASRLGARFCDDGDCIDL